MLVSAAELLKETPLSRIHIRVSLRWRDVSCLGNGFISTIEFLHYVILISADTSGTCTVFKPSGCRGEIALVDRRGSFIRPMVLQPYSQCTFILKIIFTLSLSVDVLMV